MLLVFGERDNLIVSFLELDGQVEKGQNGILVLRLVLLTNQLSHPVDHVVVVAWAATEKATCILLLLCG